MPLHFIHAERAPDRHRGALLISVLKLWESDIHRPYIRQCYSPISVGICLCVKECQPAVIIASHLSLCLHLSSRFQAMLWIFFLFSYTDVQLEGVPFLNINREPFIQLKKTHLITLAICYI